MLKDHTRDNLLPPCSQKGSAILEGLIAILIFSLGILALIGLQASAMKATTASKFRVDASLVANQRIANMWADRDNLAAYVEPVTALPASAGLPSGTRQTQVAGTLVTVTVRWQPPGGMASNYVTRTNIVGNS
ncbi:MAG: hypothetical protein H6R18_21 [Proteobacteria bacterium]|nr:hypothetical protein [Pseudomonadota bacterium]